MAVKYTTSLNSELRRVIRNYNNKIYRLEKSERDLILPEKANIKAIKERITNKWELNRELANLEAFTKRGAEETITTKGGASLSKYEYQRLQREQRRLVQRLTREIERYGNIKPREFGKVQSATYAQMGDEKVSNLKAKRKAIARRKLRAISNEELKSLKTLINKANANYRKDKNVFYDNYLDGTLLNLGYYVGYDKEKLDYIKNKLNELTPEQFLKAFNTEVSLKDIQDRYVLSHEEGITPEILESDVQPVLDALYDNIDSIIADYKK